MGSEMCIRDRAQTAVMRPCLNKLDAPHAAILGKGLVSFHPLRFYAKCIGNKIFQTEFATQIIPVPTDFALFSIPGKIGCGSRI